MTDKEKLEKLVSNMPDYYKFEDFVFAYLWRHESDFDLSRIFRFITHLQNSHMEYMVSRYERIRSIASERAMYLDIFLNGEMYKTEEAARKNLPCQIENARAIRRACAMKEED